MFSRVDRIVVNVAVALLVFVGVSASVSEWFDTLYSEIAFWTLIVGVPVGMLIYWIKGFDPDLSREIRRAQRENGATVAALVDGKPELARELAKLADAKRRQEQGFAPAPSVTPPTGG